MISVGFITLPKISGEPGVKLRRGPDHDRQRAVNRRLTGARNGGIGEQDAAGRQPRGDVARFLNAGGRKIDDNAAGLGMAGNFLAHGGDLRGQPAEQFGEQFNRAAAALGGLTIVQRDAFEDFFPGNSALRGEDNVHEGLYIDDIIIGLAERGELGTTAGSTPGAVATDSSYVSNPLFSPKELINITICL